MTQGSHNSTPSLMLLEGESSHICKLHPLWFSLPLLVGLPARGAKPNRVQFTKKERENGQDRGRGTHNVPQYIAALQMLKCVT